MIGGAVEFPKMSQDLINGIDATPSDDYPLRILKVYRANCDCFWELSGSGVSEAERAVWDLMNEHQRKRAAVLDRAIKILEQNIGSGNDLAVML